VPTGVDRTFSALCAIPRSRNASVASRRSPARRTFTRKGPPSRSFRRPPRCRAISSTTAALALRSDAGGGRDRLEAPRPAHAQAHDDPPPDGALTPGAPLAQKSRPEQGGIGERPSNNRETRRPYRPPRSERAAEEGQCGAGRPPWPAGAPDDPGTPELLRRKVRATSRPDLDVDGAGTLYGRGLIDVTQYDTLATVMLWLQLERAWAGTGGAGQRRPPARCCAICAERNTSKLTGALTHSAADGQK
jgi:hypothetical protein